MNVIEATQKAQSDLIRQLRKENEELMKEIEELKRENKRLKNKLDDAEAIIVCNRIVKPEGAKKTFFVPAKAHGRG